MSVGGTAKCETFLFFQTVKNGRAQLLPELPRKGGSDGQNSICSGFHDDGYLARVNRVDVFLELSSGETDHNYTFRVVSPREGHWANACSVEARFRTMYRVDKVFVPNDGPVSVPSLMAVAAQIVEQRAGVRDSKAFTFGPPIPDGEKERVRTMIELAARVEVVPVPAFGAEKELGQFHESLASADFYPLILGGRAYLVRLGHATLGWRVFSESILVLYTLKEGNLEPVGSAIVQQGRGTLASLRAVSAP
jgi:hypothetical protein